jgi:membrane protease subunit (stomatin/prohibitin family)
MALFGKPKAGGFMDEIRCDEHSFLIWKWRPNGASLGNNNRENAIRWGSSLRVREGEVAVFVYSTKDGTYQDFIEGPCDTIVETENLPVIASVIGLAYQGGTPFPAEVYYINLARVIQVPFGVPYFDLFDPRFLDFGVPTAVRGKITFNIADYKDFITLHGLRNFDLNAFQSQIKDAVTRYVKSVVANAPAEKNIPVAQIERYISDINDLVERDVKDRLERDFGVNVTALDVNAIDIDKSSEGYKQLNAVTKDLATERLQTQQRIDLENIEETMRIQREEAQYAQHKKTQMENFAAYQVEAQTTVGVAGAEALGQMGLNGATEISGSGAMNPAAMMTGMAMGGAIGQNLAGTMTGMMQGINNPQQAAPSSAPTPPPIPAVAYHVAVDGKAEGPYNLDQLKNLVMTGKLTAETLVWKQGMQGWEKACDQQDLVSVFNAGAVPPPIPGV